jgi:hypothetical protein
MVNSHCYPPTPMMRSSSSLTVLLLVVVTIGCSCNIGANAFAPGRSKGSGGAGSSNGSISAGGTTSSTTSSTAITTTALLNTYLLQVEEMSRNRELGDLSPFSATLINGAETTVAPDRNGKAAVSVYPVARDRNGKAAVYPVARDRNGSTAGAQDRNGSTAGAPDRNEKAVPDNNNNSTIENGLGVGDAVSTQYDQMLFQMNLEARDAMHRMKMGNIQAANAKQTAEMQTKLEKMANEHENYKLAIQREKEEAARYAEQKQADLLKQSAWLEMSVEEQKEAARQDKVKAQENWKKRMALEAALSSLEKEYAAASKKWKEAAALPERARVQDQATAAKKLQAMNAAVDKQEDEKLAMLTRYQKELEAKDAVFRNQIADLQEAKLKEVRALETKLEKMANDWQEFKLESHREHMVTSQSADNKLQATTNQITMLQTSLEEQKRVTYQQEIKAKEHYEKRLEAQAELAQLQKDYAKAVQDWDTTLEKTQDARAKDQAATAKQLEAMQKEVQVTEQEKVQRQLDFQRELAARDTMHRNTIGNLQAEKAREIQALQSRSEKMASELQDVKLVNQRQASSAVQAAEKQKDALAQQVANLQTALAKQEQATKQQSLNAQEFWEKRMSLEDNLSELQKDYSNAVEEWEVAYQLEQNKRAADQATAASQLQAMQEQVQFKEQEKMQLQLDMQRDAAAKEQVHRDKFNSLQTAKAAEIQALQRRLEKMSNEWQAFELSTQKQQVAARQAAGEKEGALQQVITNLQSTLEAQKEATKEEGIKAKENWTKRMESEAELSQLQKDYAKAVEKWEVANILENKARVKDQVVAASQMHALQAKGQAEEQEKRLQRELAAKDALYLNKIALMEAMKGKEIQALQSRLETLANELQDYKLSSHHEHVKTTTAVAQEKDALSQQIANLQTTLRNQEKGTADQSQKVQMYLDQRVELEAQLKQFQRESQQALQTLEAAYVREQKANADNQATAVQRLSVVETEARRKLWEARSGGREVSERVRIDLTSRLVRKEKEILEAKITLSDREDLITKWSAERASARTMALHAVQLVKMRIVSRISRFKNRVQQGAVDRSSQSRQNILSEWRAAWESAHILARETGKVLMSGSMVLLLFTPVASTVVCEKVSDASWKIKARWSAANAD